MEKPAIDFICPICKKKSKISLAAKEFSTFQVKCPACGKTIQLHSIKGFKQLKLGKPSKERARRDFRDAENPSNN